MGKRRWYRNTVPGGLVCSLCLMRTTPPRLGCTAVYESGRGHVLSSKPWPQPPPCHFLTQRRARCFPTTSPAGLTPSEEPPFALASHLMSLPRVSRQTSGLQALQKVAAGVLRNDRYLQLQVPPALLCSAAGEGATPGGSELLPLCGRWKRPWAHPPSTWSRAVCWCCPVLRPVC